MVLTTLLSCAITGFSLWLYFQSEEEIIKVSMATVALLAGFLMMICSPWFIKAFILVLPLIMTRKLAVFDRTAPLRDSKATLRIRPF